MVLNLAHKELWKKHFHSPSLFKNKKARHGGTCLKSQLLGRQRSRGLWFEVDSGKKVK
jgi:hypothetical protein